MPLRGNLSEEEIERVETWDPPALDRGGEAGEPVGQEWMGLQEAGRDRNPPPSARRLGPQPDRRVRPGEARESGLEPAQPASKRALAAGSYLDLVGMPPSPRS